MTKHLELSNQFRQMLINSKTEFSEYEQHSSYAFICGERQVMFSKSGILYGLHKSIRTLGDFDLCGGEINLNRVFQFLTVPNSLVPSIIAMVNNIRNCLLEFGVNEYDIRLSWDTVYIAKINVTGNSRILAITPDLYIIDFGYVDFCRAIAFLIDRDEDEMESNESDQSILLKYTYCSEGVLCN